MQSSDTRYRLIRLIADGAFHSGQDLADGLSISRAAVWKHIDFLRNATGLQIDSIRGKGYRLATPMELLRSATIRGEMNFSQARALCNIHLHDSIDSTNTWLMKRAASGAPAPSACLAERQTTGRGRHGRVWVSPYGTNIYLSLHWRFDLAPAQIGGLSLACGVAVVQALERLGISGLALKWPNDVLLNRRKLAGLLLEVRGESSGPSDVIAGVGVNTRMPVGAACGIDQPWVDLSGLFGPDAEYRNRLAALLIEEMLVAMQVFSEKGLDAFIERWQSYDHFRGEQIVLRMGGAAIAGDYLGVDGTGAIRLKVKNGVRSFQAGEVNLLKVHRFSGSKI